MPLIDYTVFYTHDASRISDIIDHVSRVIIFIKVSYTERYTTEEVCNLCHDIVA